MPSEINQMTKGWEEIEKEILNNAKVVFCTASTASREILEGFSADYVLIAEASQISEDVCLIPIPSQPTKCQKHILSGDIAQQPLLRRRKDAPVCKHRIPVPLWKGLHLPV